MIGGCYGSDSYGDRNITDSVNVTLTANSLVTNSMAFWRVLFNNSITGNQNFAVRDLRHPSLDLLMHGRLLDEVKFRRSRSVNFFGMKEPVSLTLQISNIPEQGDTMGYFDRHILNGAQYEGMYVQINRRDKNDPIITTGANLNAYVERMDIGIERASFTVSDEQRTFDSLMPPTVLTKDTFIYQIPLAANRPEIDLGKALPFGYGYVKNQPLVYVKEDLSANQYDYILSAYPIETTNSNRATTLSIERSEDGRTWVTVDPVEYTVLDGTYADYFSPYGFNNQYSAVRFTVQQLGWNNNYYLLRASYRGRSSTSGGTCYQTAAQVASTILADFNGTGIVPITDLDQYCIDKNLNVAGYFGMQQRRVREGLEELFLIMGAWAYQASQSGNWAVRPEVWTGEIAASFGFNDGRWNNIAKVVKHGKLAPAELPKNLVIEYRYVEGQGFTARKTRNMFSSGRQELVKQCHFIWDDETADRVACMIQRRIAGRPWHLTIVVNTEGRLLDVNDVVYVTIPYKNISGYWLVTGVEYALLENKVDLINWDPQALVHVPS